MCKKSQYLITVLLVTLLVAGLALISGCSNDDELVQEPEPDPPFSADFFIYENFQTGWPEGWVLYGTDTVLAPYVTFRAEVEDADYYEWKLGAETINKKEFTRWGFPTEETIEMSLKVHKINELGILEKDSLTRSFYVKPFHCDNFSHMAGIYEGYTEDNPDELKIAEIEPCNDTDINVPYGTWLYKISNLQDGCSIYFEYGYIAWRGFFTRNPRRIDANCEIYSGMFRFYENGEIRIEIEFGIGPLLGEKVIFNGQKQ